MSREARKQRGGPRRVADAALDVAIGGTALAVDKAVEALEKAGDRAGETARATRRAVEREIEGTDTRPYEERTRDELYQLAVERDIEGRSAMLKSDLITALRAER